MMLLTSLESSSDEDDPDLAMPPLIEKANAETDMDSDASDDMNDGLVHHLPRRLLNSTCDLSLLDKGNKQKYVQHTQLPNKKSRKSAARNWKKSTDLQPTWKLSEASAVYLKNGNKSPIDGFKAMFSDDLVLMTFIVVLLLSVYCKVLYRNLYWADAPDTHNKTVSCAMSRNRFREILSNFHLADNTQITEDRYYKV